MRAILIALALYAVCWQSSTACRADILVAGFDADAVIRFDSAGAPVGTFATHATMNGPTAMVYNSAGHLLVLNEVSGNVLEFDGTTGTFIGTLIAPASLGSVGITDPGDMEIGPDGHLYISNHFSTGGMNVWKFHGTTGAYLGMFASTGVFHHTHGLAFGPDGNLYQHDLATATTIRFDGTTGALITPTPFTFHPGLATGADLVFGPTGTMFASLDGGGGLISFDSSGMFLSTLIPSGSTSTWGLLVDGGILYVGGKSTGFVKKYDATTGAFLGDFTTFSPFVFDMLVLPTAAVPEAGAAAMLTLAATCAAAGVALEKWRK